MASFVVMRPKNDSTNDDVHFVRDGFSVLGFAFPIIWLAWHRLWLHAAIWFGISGLIAALVYWSGNPLAIGVGFIASIATNLLVALEGGNWVKHNLEREGYVEADVISARFEKEAEEVFASRFETTHHQKPASSFGSVTSLIPLNGKL
jgi:Protein of unknown function (DUF2628)